MKVLVLTMDYPRLDGTHERMFVHVRNLFYAQNNIDVTVLNFSSPIDYEIDGIKVVSLESYEKEKNNYDILVSHASNLRNHYKFLRKYNSEFHRIVFFFHGHEVLYLNKDYPKPYSFKKQSIIRNAMFQNAYDKLKMSLWASYYRKNIEKCYFVFVSNWIKNRFMENLHFTKEEFQGHDFVINNSIGETFEYKQYDYRAEKKYDYITIRGNLDGSKYGVDLVVELAKRNPDKKFLLIGRGCYFNYNEKPFNVELIGRTLNHEEMLEYIDKSKYGLLLTREDTQGVMTCEFASYGIPTITSDIEVCHEFFDSMPNVEMISNNLDFNLEEVSCRLAKKIPYKSDDRFYAKNTILKEIMLFEKILN